VRNASARCNHSLRSAGQGKVQFRTEWRHSTARITNAVFPKTDSMKLVDEHDGASVVIDLRVQRVLLVWRHAYSEVQGSGHGCY